MRLRHLLATMAVSVAWAGVPSASFATPGLTGMPGRIATRGLTRSIALLGLSHMDIMVRAMGTTGPSGTMQGMAGPTILIMGTDAPTAASRSASGFRSHA